MTRKHQCSGPLEPTPPPGCHSPSSGTRSWEHSQSPRFLLHPRSLLPWPPGWPALARRRRGTPGHLGLSAGTGGPDPHAWQPPDSDRRVRESGRVCRLTGTGPSPGATDSHFFPSPRAGSGRAQSLASPGPWWGTVGASGARERGWTEEGTWPPGWPGKEALSDLAAWVAINRRVTLCATRGC